MARRSIQDNIEAGILTIPNLIRIMGLSSNYVRSLIALAKETPASMFPVLAVPGSREVRIPAGPFYDYCVACRFPVPRLLEQAAVNYRNRYIHHIYPKPVDPYAPFEPKPVSDAAIYATADGTPASFIPSAPPPVDEMTPYMGSPMTPLPLHPDSVPLPLSNGNLPSLMPPASPPTATP